ncbi:MAG: hypothetical protein GY769_01675 [bacterium]|nr:hypothetical protein [bacterium]
MMEIAEAYVKLVLAVGRHDSDYVDACYGPEEWKSEVDAEEASLEQLHNRAGGLIERLAALGDMDSGAGADGGEAEMQRLRYRYLATQLGSLGARVEMLQGKRLSFDEESRALYDAVSPNYGDEHYQAILDELDPLLSGEGSLIERYARFKQRFVIPAENLDQVFRAAIEACRARTLEWIELPEGESFEVEYVQDKSWSAYNWYQGGFHSLIQVNTDLPIYIDRAIDLACHEGYPGHHVYNLLLEKHLVRDRGWVEFSVYPLFSPQSLIAEGTANFGIRAAFPGAERIAFEREVLFPLAGLDSSLADRFYRVLAAVEKLDYAGNEAARSYLDREIDAQAAAEKLTRYALMPPQRAAQRVRFIDQYRSYVINYNLGQDMVRRYVEANASTPEETWRVFGELLSSPRLPSGLL